MSDPMMIPCDQVIARLWEYIDGELEPSRAAEVSAHLKLCERCFPQYDYQRAYREFIRRTRGEAVPSGLRRRIFEMILAQEPAGRRGLRGWLHRLLGKA
jgi:anti-sigma factor (TIGR02949 family)